MRTFSTIESVVEFSLRFFGVLRKERIEISSHQELACVRGIERLKVVKPYDLKSIYRITLINQPDDLEKLTVIFEEFMEWYFTLKKNSKSNEALSESKFIGCQYKDDSNTSNDQDLEDDQFHVQTYSTIEMDTNKDFRLFPKQQLSTIIDIFGLIVKKNRSLSYRKWKPSRKGRRIDLRSSIRQCVRYDGDVARWSYKKKIPNFTRLVVALDVSGSMEVYSLFFLSFLHELARHRRLKVEVFVFSTELECLTAIFRLKSFKEMLEKLSSDFSGWSGGTKIGRAIRALNRDYTGAIRSDTLVTIMSDGWDTGEPDLLKNEMENLSRKAKSIVWINPLKGDPYYEPVATGMAVARPFCDEFISGHNIASLERYGEMIL